MNGRLSIVVRVALILAIVSLIYFRVPVPAAVWDALECEPVEVAPEGPSRLAAMRGRSHSRT